MIPTLISHFYGKNLYISTAGILNLPWSRQSHPNEMRPLAERGGVSIHGDSSLMRA
jgi:hypothetical protein